MQTVSEDETSAPTTAQYRTVPLRPLNVTFNPSSLTSTSFLVSWSPPNGTSEFDKYQISLGNNRRVSPITKNRHDHDSTSCYFASLDPGKTYQVVVKTVSGKVTSWPANNDITLKPLPVLSLQAKIDERMLEVSWRPDNASTQDSYRLSYHEVDSTAISIDSSTLITASPKITLEALLPGRNYTLTVQSISNKVESNETTIYQVTRPSSPIIEDLKSIERGLNISWKSDVNSRQEKFEITHTRNDTGESATTLTTESHIILEDLYPGAGYEVKVFAISHGLKSEPHDYFQAVLPHPPQNLRIEKVFDGLPLGPYQGNNSVLVSWSSPQNSLFSEYSIRYRTEDDKSWIKLPSVRETEAEVTDMTPGERYTIQVNTVSFGVESLYPLQVNHTVSPNPVADLKPRVDSNNVTLEFNRPEGRIEVYSVKWWPVDDPLEAKTKNISGVMDESIDDDKIQKFVIEDLIPGVEYSFSIFTTSYGLWSDTVNATARTMPLIQSEVVLVIDRDLPGSLTLRYTPTPVQSSKFDLYRFQISDDLNTTREKLIEDLDTKVSFVELVPGRLYNVTMWTVSEGVVSRPLLRQDRLYPEAINTINAVDVNDTSIKLTWDIPKGEYDAYEVQYINSDGNYIQNITHDDKIVISELKPHRNYTFTLVVCSGYGVNRHLRRSNPVSGSFTTSESFPGRVENFYPTDVQPSDISFEWFLPKGEYNGIVKKFTITYGLEGSGHVQVKDFKENEFKGIIRGLVPGKTYVFRIQAETKIGFGPEAVLKQKMPIFAPPKPPTQVVPTEVCRSTTTIQIRFRKNYFSEQHGAVVSYTVIVAEDDSKNASGLEMPSWRDVQAYSIWPPYQVSMPHRRSVTLWRQKKNIYILKQ